MTLNTDQTVTAQKVFDATSFSTPNGGKALFKGSDATGWVAWLNSSGTSIWDFASGNTATSFNINETGVANRFKLYAGGNCDISGNVTASAFYQSSDIRFKNVLESNPIINVSGIDVIKYVFTDDEKGLIRYGYSAQQVQEILPDLVFTQADSNRLHLNYVDVHTLKIAALEKKVAELEEKLNKLLS